MNVVRLEPPGAFDPNQMEALESGDILCFPQPPFDISREDREALLRAGQADGNFHKNISYKPVRDEVTGLGRTVPGEVERIKAALRSYSQNVIRLLERVLPLYAGAWKTDYASFRSVEEEGRHLPWKKRNDLLHTDAFPTRPTNGDLILRTFTNIHPTRERVWVTTDAFPAIAESYARAAGLPEISARSTSLFSASKRTALALARFAGLPVVPRSPYDEFMLAFHDFLKGNADFQQNTPKYRFAFPPDSTWMVFTDLVPHAVLSGRFALEQTMIVARRSLLDPENAPVAALERLSAARLTI